MFGQKLSAIFDVLKVLLTVKGEDLQKILEAAGVISGDADVKTKILAGISIAEVVARYTPIEEDDEIVGVLKQLANEDMIWKLVDIVTDIIDGKDTAEVSAALNDGEVPVGAILQLAVYLADMIKGLSK
jgi:hypothetical protein